MTEAVNEVSEEVKVDRKKPAKQLTPEQIKRTMELAFEGKAPAEIAAIIGDGVERNQTYRVITMFKARCVEVLEDETAPAELKAKAQAQLDRIPAREFGATAGSRVSILNTTIEAMLAEL